MADSESTSLAELADQVAATAKQVLTLSDHILRISKTSDLLMDKTHTLARCVVDACTLLALQLRNLSSRDEAALTEANEKFWPALRLVMDLWLENEGKSVAILGDDARLQTSRAGRAWRRVRAAGEFTAFGPPKMQEGTLADVQMVHALLLLHSESLHPTTPSNRLDRHVLAHDLDCKATQLRMRMSHTRQEAELPLAWGQTHERLVDVAVDVASRVKGELGVAEGDGRSVEG